MPGEPYLALPARDFAAAGTGTLGCVTGRLVIEDIRPATPHPGFSAKAIVGERVRVTAVMFKDGHEPIAGWAALFRQDETEPESVADLIALGNDEWEATLVPRRQGQHYIQILGWAVRYGQNVDFTTSERVRLWVDRERALVGAWYELFPRSFGGFKGVLSRIPEVAEMGFDILYFPPIHPIGQTFRKGPNNTLVADPDDPGSPWAIGSEEGGHTAINPDLGTEDDLLDVIEELRSNGMELALDYALQCSPDHPWVREHPEWFHHRPDGTIACAENPPKIYQDIYPLNFWPPSEEDRVSLWNACKEIFDHWISLGVRVFRVDNPHTKPMAFWEWVIAAVQKEHPDVIFLAEAFTRPKVMARLAESGFTQSYTYFTWRTEQHGVDGLWAYLEEIANGPKADYMRPNFWPNTPDILSGPLRNGPPSAFALRLVLAATMSPSYGVYSGYELYENEPASETNEEYLHSEKYEIKHRDYDRPDSLAPLMTALNRIRRRHPALQQLRNIHFHPSANPQIIAYSKTSDTGDDTVLVVVNLDPYWNQESTLSLDLAAMDFEPYLPMFLIDELDGTEYIWYSPQVYVKLEPGRRVAHIFSVTQNPARA
jgi:starch synthase (maltosyl-transferring)